MAERPPVEAGDGPQPWKVISSRIVFDNPWYTLRQDTVRLLDGTIVPDYFVSVRPDVAIVLAITTADAAVCVRQYKHGAGEVTLELPAGNVDPGEPPEAAAARELREETGYVVARLVPIGVFFDDTSKNTHRVFAYLAEDVQAVSSSLPNGSEQGSPIAVELVPLTDLVEMVRRSIVVAQSSVAAIYRGWTTWGGRRSTVLLGR